MKESAAVTKIKAMLAMEEMESEKDEAGVYRPAGVESAVRKKAFQDVLRWLSEGEL